MKKAYIVEVDVEEHSMELVFAESRNKARMAAMGSASYDDIPYIHLHPRRLPQADHLLERRPDLVIASSHDSEHARLMRDLGWCEADGHRCDVCGLGEFDSVPESWLTEDGVCKECCELCAEEVAAAAL